MSLEKIERGILILRHLCEIAALVFASWWAYTTFVLKEQPSLEETIQVNNEIEIDPIDLNTALVSLNLEIKNIGKSSFDIDSFRSNNWGQSIDSFITRGSILDLEQYLHDHMDSNFVSRPDKVVEANQQWHSYYNHLNGHYAPGFSYKHTFRFKVPRCATWGILSFYIIYPHCSKEGNEKPKSITSYSFKPVPMVNKEKATSNGK